MKIYNLRNEARQIRKTTKRNHLVWPKNMWKRISPMIRQRETPGKDTTRQHKQHKPVDQPIKLKEKAKEQGDRPR